MVSGNAFTKIDDDIFTCNDCGAHASSPEDVKHYESCKPGEAERWGKYYSDPEWEKSFTEEC
jgi:hypothetical protein